MTIKNQKALEMRKDAISQIIEVLDWYDDHYCDLQYEVFNTDYYIVGTHEAKKALEEYDIFSAIGRVYTYEKENFGEVYTDLSDPEKLVDMLFYIIGEEVLQESQVLSDNWDNVADKETNQKIIEELEKMLKT